MAYQDAQVAQQQLAEQIGISPESQAVYDRMIADYYAIRPPAPLPDGDLSAAIRDDTRAAFEILNPLVTALSRSWTLLKGTGENAGTIGVKFIEGTTEYILPIATPTDPNWHQVILLLQGRLSDRSAYATTLVNNGAFPDPEKHLGIVSINTSNGGLQAPGGGYDFLTGDFTVESWIKMNGTVSGDNAMPLFMVNGYGGIWLGVIGANIVFRTNNGNVIAQYTAPTINTGWVDIAVTVKDRTVRLFIGGTKRAELVTNLSFPKGDYVYIGYDGTGAFFKGLISGLRVTKGLARYTADYTVPTALLPTS